MKSLIIPMALLLALSVPALAGQNGQGQNNNNQGQNGGNYKGAPGPLVGAGLPVLLIGGGIYWLVRRRKKQAGTP
jgi:LPXTG-motif cell wall-anchored protein